jgi:hypothetical protein
MFVIKHLSQRWSWTKLRRGLRRTEEMMRGFTGSAAKGFIWTLAMTLSLITLTSCSSTRSASPTPKAQVNNPRRRPRIGCGFLNVA